MMSKYGLESYVFGTIYVPIHHVPTALVVRLYTTPYNVPLYRDIL